MVVDLRVLEEQHLVLEGDLVRAAAVVVGAGDEAREDLLHDAVVAELDRGGVFSGETDLRLELLGEAYLRPVKIRRLRGEYLKLDARVQ